jgi:hypothetical protein
MPDSSRSRQLQRNILPGHGGGVVIHDDDALENEECIMNNAAPTNPAIGIPSRTPRAPRSLRSHRIVNFSSRVSARE